MVARITGVMVASVLACGVIAGWASGDTVPPEVPVPASHRHHVPNLIGKKPPSVNRILEKRHFRVRYTGLSNACAGIPPAGHIIDQAPKGGALAPAGSVVRLQTSCGD
jgi:beta-lactam-binding protein with PASTA domain